MNACIVPGSFDPVTLGHVDIIKRARNLFPKVVVALLPNGEKHGFFSISSRVAFLQKATADIPDVEIVTHNGMLWELAAQRNIFVIVRGLRNSVDFAYEQQMAEINNVLGGSRLETVFLSSRYPQISSGAVREILKGKGNIAPFVCAQLVDELVQAAKEKR